MKFVVFLTSTYMICMLYFWYHTLPKLDFKTTYELIHRRIATSCFEQLTWLEATNDYLLPIQRVMREPIKYSTPNASYNINVKATRFSGVAVRVYIPPMEGDGEEEASNPSPRPGILHLSGDTWTFGSLEKYAAFCHRLAHETHSVVVGVRYRLAPEFPYPAALDDIIATYKYFSQHAFKYAVDPRKILVMGESGGGNLALAATLRLRDEGFAPGVRAQVLVHPIVQVLTLHAPAHQLAAQAQGYSRYLHAVDVCSYLFGSDCPLALVTTISRSQHVSPSQRQQWAKSDLNLHDLPPQFSANYIYPDLTTGNATLWEEIHGRFVHPYVSPLLANGLDNLPETFLLNMNFASTRDEVYWLKEKLEREGVKVVYRFVENGFDGMLSERYLALGLESSVEEFEELVKFIKNL